MSKYSRTERLQKWIETLSTKQMKKILLETVDFCIDAEMVAFYESSKTPYWDNTGERLDGLEDEEEDD